ncbi:MAG: P1 family peptidase [Nitrospinota bacterium]
MSAIIKKGIRNFPGIKIGHHNHKSNKSGLTVAIFDQSLIAASVTLGGAPGLSETTLLEDGMTVSKIDAILLTGGSVYGLDAAAGVRQFLQESNQGFKVGSKVAPIVPTAVIYDLDEKEPGYIFPDAATGYIAAKSANELQGEKVGKIGAGVGAKVAKYLGNENGADGGIGALTLTLEDDVQICVLLVVNAFGGLINRTDKKYVLPKGEAGGDLSFLESEFDGDVRFGSTIIGFIATNVKLSKSDAKRIAIMSMAGIARSVYPAFTRYDGDTLFAVSTGQKRYDLTKLGGWGAYLVEQAILDTVGISKVH